MGRHRTGRWWNAAETAQIEVVERDGALFGIIVWLKNRNPDGTLFRDVDNPDPALRDRPVLGIELLRNLRPGRRAERVRGSGT